MSYESGFLRNIAQRDTIRTSIRAIVLGKERILAQKPSNNPNACYAFIGGEYEVGDTFKSRHKQEFEEETNAEVVDCQYLFVL